MRSVEHLVVTSSKMNDIKHLGHPEPVLENRASKRMHPRARAPRDRVDAAARLTPAVHPVSSNGNDYDVGHNGSPVRRYSPDNGAYMLGSNDTHHVQTDVQPRATQMFPSQLFGLSAATAKVPKHKPMYQIPKYSKNLLGNWRGCVWEHAAIPRGMPYFFVACSLTAFFVWRIKAGAHDSVTSPESIDLASIVPDSGDGASAAAIQVVQLLLAAGTLTGGQANREHDVTWDRPYPYQAFAFILGFLLIFRCFSLLPLHIDESCGRASRKVQPQGSITHAHVIAYQRITVACDIGISIGTGYRRPITLDGGWCCVC